MPDYTHEPHDEERILVLGGRRASREAFARILEQRGRATMQCATLDEAVEAVESAGPGLPFDYAFVDLSVAPGEPGQERPGGLAAIARLSEESSTTSVIAFCMADKDTPRDLGRQALSAGADDYIIEGSYTAEELVDLTLERFGFLRELRERLRAYEEESDPMVQALHQLGVGVAIIDRHLRVWYANDTLRRELGVPGDRRGGLRARMACRDLFGCRTPVGSCRGCCVTAALRGEGEDQRTALLPVARRLRDGRQEPTLRYFQLTAKPITSRVDTSRAIAVLETAQDITDTLAITGMDRQTRLELLARAILDIGFSRCRIYERGEGPGQVLHLVTFVGGDQALAGHPIHLEHSHAAGRRGQWEAGAAWFPAGYEREPWHEELGLPADHRGWVDWPVFGRGGRLLGWIAADTAPVAPEFSPWPGSDPSPFVGREVGGDDVEALRIYADHAAQILASTDDAMPISLNGEAEAVSALDSRVLIESASPSEAATWLLDLLVEHVPGVAHATLRYISEWTQSAVLLASRGPLDPYLEREMSLYDVRRPSARILRTGQRVVHELGPSGAWDDEMVEWLSSANPQFGPALARYRIRQVIMEPLQLEHRMLGTLGVFATDPAGLERGASRWLVERVAERAQAAASAARMQDRLRSEAIDQAMPDLLPAIAHKLGSPLFLITRELRAWNRDNEAGKASVEQADAMLGSIGRHLQRIDRIRREFLQVASAGTGAPKVGDLAEVLTAAVAAASEGAGPAFRVEYTGSVRRALALVSAEDMTEVFYELTANAMRALDGEGVLSICVDAYPADAAAPQAWRITFENAGHIPVEDKSRIFDPFYTTNLATGTGLGLALVRRLLRANDATIREIGTGSVIFEVIVPARQ